eukprot:scaffold22113_cov93-Cylindrotheca_fusiformis.AAC.1
MRYFVIGRGRERGTPDSDIAANALGTKDGETLGACLGRSLGLMLGSVLGVRLGGARNMANGSAMDSRSGRTHIRNRHQSSCMLEYY